MPEGDTVRRTAQRLDLALRARVVTISDLRWPSLAVADLTGARTLEVVSRGKHLLHRFDSGLTLHSHLRMEGQWRIAAADPPTRLLGSPQVRAVIGTDTWVALGLRLGMLDLVATSDERSVVGMLGPDVLDPDWLVAEGDSRTRVAATIAADHRPIGEVLLDQTVLAGVGTVWASESLFAQRIHPWLPAAALDAGRSRELLDRVGRLMRAGPDHRVHARSGRPCLRCGATIRIARVGTPPQDRAMFYCADCQGGLAPGDDGSPVAPLGAGRGRRPGRR